MNDIPDPDELFEEIEKILSWLIDSGYLKTKTPKESIYGNTTCKFCNCEIKYWQSNQNGHRGFQCSVCADNMTFQE